MRLGLTVEELAAQALAYRGRVPNIATRCAVFAKSDLVHVNPMFCCPGVVSSSIFRKIQKDFALPIVDIFYDGTGEPNKILIPHLHYLKRKNST